MVANNKRMTRRNKVGGATHLNQIYEEALEKAEDKNNVKNDKSETISSDELKDNTLKPSDKQPAKKGNVEQVKYDLQGRPSKAMLALIDRYKCTSQKDLVGNTIDEIVSDNIYKIQQAVTNMIKYGDSKVFKLLPKELDSEMRDYGMAAQEYFGKKIAELNNLPVYVVPVTYRRCNKCKQYKSDDEFYSTQSDIYDGKFPICKECTKTLFKEYLKKYKDIKEVLVLMSQKFDLYLYEPTIKRMVNYADTIEGKKELADNTFFANYLSNLYLDIQLGGVEINEPDFSKSYLGGIPFKSMAFQFNLPPVYNDRIIAEGEEIDELEDENLSAGKILRLRRTWGDSYTLEELKWLESKHQEWHNNYDIQGKNRELLVQQLCLEELSIFKGRQLGADVSKNLKNIQDMMKNSDLSPKKTASMATNSEFASLGDFIRHVEKTKPFINKDKEFEDVDGIQKLWRSIAGAIARTLGRSNEYTEEFKENYKEHTVDIESVGGSDE